MPLQIGTVKKFRTYSKNMLLPLYINYFRFKVFERECKLRQRLSLHSPYLPNQLSSKNSTVINALPTNFIYQKRMMPSKGVEKRAQSAFLKIISPLSDHIPCSLIKMLNKFSVFQYSIVSVMHLCL
jgi:hypothetical protein